MIKLEAKFSVVTPMFLAGAQHKYDSIRVSSVIGAIRFWWRALNYSAFKGDISLLQQKEAELFGGTSQQSSVLFSIVDVKQADMTNSDPNVKLKRYVGARYLAEGVFGRGRSVQRECVDSAAFTLRLCSRKTIDPTIIAAIKLFGLLGGLGSKARKGFGSVNLHTLAINSGKAWETLYEIPNDFSAYKEDILSLIRTSTTYTKQPKISAFASCTSLWMLQEGTASSALSLLDNYGKMQQQYRSWGQTKNGNLVNGKVPEKRFKADRDWFRKVKNAAVCENFHPQRAVFGLPHNYGSNELYQVTPEYFKRRASPLFHHIHQLGNQCFSIAFIMESDFLPRDEQISAGGNIVPPNIEYAVLNEFICAKGKESRQDYFPNKQAIYTLFKQPLGQP